LRLPQDYLKLKATSYVCGSMEFVGGVANAYHIAIHHNHSTGKTNLIGLASRSRLSRAGTSDLRGRGRSLSRSALANSQANVRQERVHCMLGHALLRHSATVRETLLSLPRSLDPRPLALRERRNWFNVLLLYLICLAFSHAGHSVWLNILTAWHVI
jgi:hypothetical protein